MTSGGGARFWRRFKRNRGGVAGAAMVGALLVFALVGPLVVSHDPYASDFAHGVVPGIGPVGPGRLFWLGTDRIFRDQLARLAFGARISLTIGVAATVIASAIGGAVGIVAGYYEGDRGIRVPWSVALAIPVAIGSVIAGRPGWALGVIAVAAASRIAAEIKAIEALKEGPRLNADAVLMRSVDVGLSFPFLLLVMAIGAAIGKTTVGTIVGILGVTGWLGIARIIRAKTMIVRNLDFVLAARALGQSTRSILARHVLPNVAGPLVVLATISVAQMILAEAVLGYLGVGLPPPAPTWGHMLFEGQDYYVGAPWLVLAPAAAILLAVFGFNLLGEGLRDALDPKEQ